MKLKKLISVGLTACMLASLAGGAGMVYASDSTEATEDISITWEDSHFYPEMSLGKFLTLNTYGVKGYEEVPFIAVQDYLEVLFEGKARTTVENGVMTVDVSNTQIVIDPSADTIHFRDPSKIRSSASKESGILDQEEVNVVIPSAEHEFVTTAGSPLDISLKEYNMPVIPYEDTIIMPFLALQNTIGALRMATVFAYNGKDYFNVFEAKMFLMEEDTNPEAKNSPYIKAITSGPWNGKKETSQAYADYGYYANCLLLDLTYGHKEEKEITTFDEYFTRMNAKESMTSTNPESAVLGEILLFNYLFDSGHDSVADLDSVFGVITPPESDEVGNVVEDIKTSEEGDDLFEEEPEAPVDVQDTADLILGVLMEKGFKIPEVAPLMAWSMFFEGIKPKDFGNERLDYAGDTAVIYFDAFKEDYERTPSYYLDPINEEDLSKDTFAFFYHCFEDIKKHSEVKNVVINLSDNGGGAAGGLIGALGFLTEDGEVCITNRDLVSGSYKEEWYHVDTNLDGVADDNDGYGGQYDFYIMCSGSSYSCGNAMPYFAQKDGLAKIIGTPPGGGDCVVGSFVDAYGRIAAYSGMLQLGTEEEGSFVSNEKATHVDLDMMPNIWDINSVPWYDAEGIADAVHQYQEGTTVMDYGVDPGTAVSDFVTGLVGQIENFTSQFDEDVTADEGAEATEGSEATEEAPEAVEGAEATEEALDEAA